MSEHQVNVVEVGSPRAHLGADRLEILEVYGYQVVSKKGTFKKGDLAVFVEPDYVVPCEEPFKFLFESKTNPGQYKTETSRGRIRTIKLRGERSYGLLIPVTDFPDLKVKDMRPGTNVMEILKIKRWEPAPPMLQGAGAVAGQPIKGPKIDVPFYDIENLQRYPEIMHEGEDCVVTEKLHGAQFRLFYENGCLFVGSRKQWKLKVRDPRTFLGKVAAVWKKLRNLNPGRRKSVHAWEMILSVPGFEKVWEFMRHYPQYVLFGEVFGPGVQKGYGYGVQGGRVGIRFFDIYEAYGEHDYGTAHRYINWWLVKHRILENDDKLYEGLRRFWVPILYEGPYSMTKMLDLAEGVSTLDPVQDVREGVVVKPVHERDAHKFGRVILKAINPAYLDKE